METPVLVIVAAACMWLFAGLSFVDGIVLHLWRYRLHARPESRIEHLVHTGRALLFAPILLTVFSDTAGWLLWLGVGFLVLDQALEMIDAAIEKRTRLALGGLSSMEYSLHLTLSSLRAAGIALALVARPAAAWGLDATHVDGAAGLDMLREAARSLLPGTLLAAALHVALVFIPVRVWGRFAVCCSKPATA